MTDIIERTDLIAQVAENPALVLTDAKAYAGWKAMVEAETARAGTDVSTSAGRDAIRSAAYKVRQSKAAIDAARKGLTEEYRAKTKAINERGNAIVEEVAALEARIRQPLTDWEAAGKALKDAATAMVERLNTAAVVTLDDTAAGVAARLAEFEALQIEAETFGDYAEAVQAVWNKVTTDLTLAVERLRHVEAERAELDRLRAEAAEREAEKVRRAEAAAAEERAARAAADAVLLARQEAEAEAERQRVAAEEKAAADRRALEEAHAAELRAEQAKTAAAERARLAQEEAAEAERQAQQKRQADQDHVIAVLGAAKAALMEAAGLDEAQARAAVLAIAKGQVPAVTVTY